MTKLECKFCEFYIESSAKCSKKKSTKTNSLYRKPCWKYRGKMERKRIKIGCLPYAIVFLSILIWIVLALIFGSESNKAESIGELVLPPAENRSGGDVNEANEDEGTWVIAAFEVPESWRNYE